MFSPPQLDDQSKGDTERVRICWSDDFFFMCAVFQKQLFPRFLLRPALFRCCANKLQTANRLCQINLKLSSTNCWRIGCSNLYLCKCAECHYVQQSSKYTIVQWDISHLVDMSGILNPCTEWGLFISLNPPCSNFLSFWGRVPDTRQNYINLSTCTLSHASVDNKMYGSMVVSAYIL